MKVREIKKGGRKERPFPKLMVDTHGSIVLFHQCKKGTVVIDKTSFAEDYWENWNMSKFTDYEGTLEISNDD